MMLAACVFFLAAASAVSAAAAPWRVTAREAVLSLSSHWSGPLPLTLAQSALRVGNSTCSLADAARSSWLFAVLSLPAPCASVLSCLALEDAAALAGASWLLRHGVVARSSCPPSSSPRPLRAAPATSIGLPGNS
jgi:hypothetical protein